jgi:hypothetical protein
MTNHDLDRLRIANLQRRIIKLTTALKTAEDFIESELETRTASLLPDPAGDDDDYLVEANSALEVVRAALAEAEGK